MPNAKTREIKFDGVPFNVGTPWKVGDKIITAADAYAINQQRIENIGHLCRKKIADMNSEDALAYVVKIDTGYVFTKEEGGKSKDPVAVEMPKVAEAWALASHIAQGLPADKKSVAVTADALMIAKEDEVRKRAVKIVADRGKIAKGEEVLDIEAMLAKIADDAYAADRAEAEQLQADLDKAEETTETE